MAEHRKPDGPDDPGAPESEEGVEAYESDWYRSLQAVANREGSETPQADAESGATDDTAGDGEEEGSDADDEKHEDSTKKKHPEGEPGIWVVATPDR